MKKPVIILRDLKKTEKIYQKVNNFHCNNQKDLIMAQKYLSIIFERLFNLTSHYQKKLYATCSKKSRVQSRRQYNVLCAAEEAEQQLLMGLIYVLQQKLITALMPHLA